MAIKMYKAQNLRHPTFGDIRQEVPSQRDI